MEFSEIKDDFLNIIENYIEAVNQKDSIYIENLKEEYNNMREEILANKKNFRKIKQRKFVKSIIKHEELSTTPKYYIKQLNSENRKKLLWIGIIYLTALNFAKLFFEKDNVALFLISLIDMIVILDECSNYEFKKEEIQNIKKLVKENEIDKV